MNLFYILMVACGRELGILRDLIEEGYDARCPTFFVKQKPRHRKSSSPIRVPHPVLDGYVFMNTCSTDEPLKLRDSFPILKVVSFSGEPALLGEEDLSYLSSLALNLEELMEIDFNASLGPQRPTDLKPGERLKIFWAGLKLDGQYIGNDYIELNNCGNAVKIKLKDAYVERIV